VTGCYGPAVRTPLAVVLVLSATLLGACGTSEDAQRKEAFCEDVPGLLDTITADLQAVYTAPETANEVLGEAVAQLEEVQPPEDVAGEWDRLRTAWGDMRDLIARADLTDPSANTDLAPELERIQPELVEAGTAVDDWGKASC
jgi:hypothetical protein